MKNYRKAKPGEVKCVDCNCSGHRMISNRLQCCLHPEHRLWTVVAMGNTCDCAEARAIKEATT